MNVPIDENTGLIMSASNSQLGTRPSLLLRLRDSSDSGAWREFVSLYGGIIHDYCLRRGLHTFDAADVSQEVLIQVSRSIGRFEYQPSRGKFRSWLAALTRSKLIAFVRHKKRNRESLTCFDDAEPAGPSEAIWSEAWCSQIAAAALRQVAKRMAPDSYAAFHATWIDEVPAASVAARFQQEVAWVYVSKSRGLKLMRESILELSDETLEVLHEPKSLDHLRCDERAIGGDLP